MSLVLTRRLGETIVLSGNIRVTVTGIQRGQVRLSIEAPRDVQIDRDEIAQRKMAERRVGT